MSAKDNDREKQRSARKKAEIDNEVNDNKEAVYNYVAARKDVLGVACITDLKLFEKGKRYLEWLSLHGHLSRMKRSVGGARQYVYNALIPFVKPTPVYISKQELDAMDKLDSITRVISLLDREQPRTTKEERAKARRSSISMGNMQSSMTMFSNW